MPVHDKVVATVPVLYRGFDTQHILCMFEGGVGNGQ